MLKKKILVVDDEPELVKAVQIRLEQANYEVLIAYNGQEGLEKAKEESPNLILLDIMMPKIDGFEFLHKLKLSRETEHIPVIMLTAKGDSGAMFKTQDLGVMDYIIKPFDTEELLELIKRYI